MPEILPGLHLVEGIDPADDTTHVYLLQNRDKTWTMVDAGMRGAEDGIFAYLDRVGIPTTSISKILITNLHPDHVGALARMAETTHARTYAHWIEAAYLAHRPRYDRVESTEKPFTVDEELKDGDRIDAGRGVIAYHTPGNTPGHTSYYEPDRALLFCGDLFVVSGARQVSVSPLDPAPQALTSKISARRMARLHVTYLLSYHGGPILQRSDSPVARAVARG